MRYFLTRYVFNQAVFAVVVFVALFLALSRLQAEPLRPVVSYDFAISTTATQSQAIAAHTKFVRVLCTATCSVALPVSPIVAAATVPIKQVTGEAEYYRVVPGTWVHVAAEENTGTVYIVEFE